MQSIYIYKEQEIYGMIKGKNMRKAIYESEKREKIAEALEKEKKKMPLILLKICFPKDQQ